MASKGGGADGLAALQARRWASLGRLLGLASGVYNRRVIEAVRRRGHRRLKLSHSHLMRGMELDGARITDLASRASVSKQAMSAIVSDMVDLGYVALRPDPADRRAKRVVYTRRGVGLVRAVVACAEEVEADYTAVLGERRAREFRRSLEMLFDALTPGDVADGSGWRAG